MSTIKLRKGLDINLKGKAAETKASLAASDEYGLELNGFLGVTPKMIVHEGDVVKVGDVLFVNKNFPDVKFSSPVSGIVSEIVRGDRRKILCVRIKADKEQQFVDFGKSDVNKLTSSDVKQKLLDAGLFGYINQLPYAVSTNPQTNPKAIFVSSLRDMPLACNFEYELKSNEEDFQTGLSALSKICTTYLGIGKKQSNKALTEAKDVEINVFDGPCPAGNVGVQINHISPINKGEVVWTVDPSVVIFIGRLFNQGKVNLIRTIAVAGNEVTNPTYVDTVIGTPIKSIIEGNIVRMDHIRIINGNPLTGTPTTVDGFLSSNSSEISVISEGDNKNELFGWILPRLNQFSTSRSYFSWLQGKKEYAVDARIKGGERHMIMSGEYDKVLPMNIYGEYLIKAIIANDIDKMEQLGIYEVSPEDFAVAEFVDSSKLELQKIVRDGLNLLRKENA